MEKVNVISDVNHPVHWQRLTGEQMCSEICTLLCHSWKPEWLMSLSEYSAMPDWLSYLTDLPKAVPLSHMIGWIGPSLCVQVSKAMRMDQRCHQSCLIAQVRPAFVFRQTWHLTLEPLVWWDVCTVDQVDLSTKYILCPHGLCLQAPVKTLPTWLR